METGFKKSNGAFETAVIIRQVDLTYGKRELKEHNDYNLEQEQCLCSQCTIAPEDPTSPTPFFSSQKPEMYFYMAL